MKLFDWVRNRGTKLGEASGDRISAAIKRTTRQDLHLPEQVDAVLVDSDGTCHYHDLDLQRSGEPHGSVRIGRYVEEGPPEYTEYFYAGQDDGRLIYREGIEPL